MKRTDLIDPKRLRGFRDYLPDIMKLRLSIMHVIREVAGKSGFDEISTPALEYLNVLLGQGGEETDKQIYRFKDHGERDVALRFDLTVPLARFVAEHQNELTFPFKRIHIGDVWRGENTQMGRYREFCQCDLDIIGPNTKEADQEILVCFYEILKALNFGEFTIRLGNRALLSAMIRKTFSILNTDQETKILIIIDKLDKIGEEKVVELLSEFQSPALCQEFLRTIFTKDSSGQTDLGPWSEKLKEDDQAVEELKRFRETAVLLQELTKGEVGQFKMDLSIARGLGYYTGVVFESFINQLPSIGSISSGGRYNDLTLRFMERSLPGVGGSVGLDRLVAALEELKKTDLKMNKTISIVIADEVSSTYAFQLAKKLRDQNLTVDVNVSGAKVGNQFKYASRKGYPAVITVGSDEMKKNTYSFKNMKLGVEERDLSFSAMIEKINGLFA